MQFVVIGLTAYVRSLSNTTTWQLCRILYYMGCVHVDGACAAAAAAADCPFITLLSYLGHDLVHFKLLAAA